MPKEAFPVTLLEARNRVEEYFSAARISDPRTEAELLIAYVCDLSRGQVRAAFVRNEVITADQLSALEKLGRRRQMREPLQHIIGRAPFRKLDLRVGPGVFVPRPETELTAQMAIDALWAIPAPHPIVLDIGTGSGAIALAIATEVPHAEVYAVEKSRDAYRWAQKNFAEISPGNAHVILGDGCEVLSELNGQVSVLVSNPPYVPEGAIPRDPEVHQYDPPPALYGGADGLDVIRDISHTGRSRVHSGGLIVIEHGEQQGSAVRSILQADRWRAAATHKDLTHRDRVTTALCPASDENLRPKM